MQTDRNTIHRHNAFYIIAFSVILLLCIIIISRIDYIKAEKRIVAQTEEALAASAREQSSLFKSQLNGQYTILKTAAETFSGHAASHIKSDEAKTLICNSLLRASDFLTVAITDKSGIATTAGGIKSDVTERWYFKENMNGRNAIAFVGKSTVSKKKLFVISVPIMTAGKPSGAVIGVYDEKNFSRMLVQQTFRAKGYSFVCDAAGRLIIGTEHANSAWAKLEKSPSSINFITMVTSVPGNDAAVSQMKNDIAVQKDGTLHYKLSDNIDRIAFYHPLGVNGWYIYSVVTKDVVDNRVISEITESKPVYIIVVLSAILLVIMVLILERRNIRQLKEDGKKIKTSEEEYKIAAAHSGKCMVRYEIEAKRLLASENLVNIYGMALVNENFPETALNSNAVAEESRDPLIKFYADIRAGKPHGSVEAVSMIFPKIGQYRWYSHEFTTIYDDSGSPVLAVITFADVTEQIEKEYSYRKWREYVDTIESNKVAFFSHDLTDDKLFDRDDLYCDTEKIFPLKAETFNEKTKEFSEKRVHPEDVHDYTAFVCRERLIAEFHNGRLNDSIDFRCSFGDNNYCWLKLTIQLIEDHDTSHIRAGLFFQNIDEQKRRDLSILAQAEQDALTKVLNREAFLGKLDHLLKSSTENTKHALIMIDLDKFKMINDTLGHTTGDNVLVELTTRLKSIMRSDDFVGRMGGDEFIICLKDIPYDAVIEKRAQQICELMRKKVSNGIYASASLGIALYPRDGKTAADLYEKADIALYYTKAMGKDSYTIFRSGMTLAGGNLDFTKDDNILTGEHQHIFKKKILIAGESSSDRKIIADIFASDMEIIEATDGTDTLRKLRLYGSSLSILLLDYVMPDMNGLEVLDIIKKDPELSVIPVIIISADETKEIPMNAAAHGAADLVRRPIDCGILKLTVESAVVKRENSDLKMRNNYLQLRDIEEQRYRKVLESTGTIVAEYDLSSGKITYDPLISQILSGNFDSRPLMEIFKADDVASDEDIAAMKNLVMQAENGGNQEIAETTIRLRDIWGTLKWFRFRIVEANTENSSDKRLIITLNDIDKEVVANQKLRYLAEYDNLTGLYNKNSFAAAVKELISKARPNTYVIIVFDVDRFKMINDLFGHTEGDRLLKYIADGMNNIKAPGDLCCRLSSDNFAFCMVYSEEGVTRFINRAKTDINKFSINYTVALSLGAYIIDDPALSVDIMLDRARIAQRTVKGSYIHTYALYDGKLRKTLLAEQEIVGTMESALSNGEFTAFLQPQFDRATNKLVGAEALVRWIHPSKGIIMPNSFITIFERTGFIVNLDRYVWELTCANVRKWKDQGIKTVPISLNISRIDIYHHELCDDLLGCLKKHGLEPKDIKVEITESAYTDNPQQVIDFVKKLQSQGLVVEMDDFGTGYSSLNILKDLPIDVLKLDMKFLAIKNKRRGPFILYSVIQMAKGLGLDIIAEGVETEEQADFLLNSDCQFQQGYFYSKPIPISDFEEKYLRPNCISPMVMS